MIDHARIRTGFDVEAILGSEFILTLVQGAYDGGKIPAELQIDPDNTLQIFRPTSVSIINDTQKNSDIELTLPVALKGHSLDVTIGLGFMLDADDGLTVEYRYVDDQTRAMIYIIAVVSHNPELFRQAEEMLREKINYNMPIDLAASSITELYSKKLVAEGQYQAGIGLYLNLDIKIAPQPGGPEDAYRSRGDMRFAQSFLPVGRFYAAGTGPKIYPNFSDDSWHKTGVPAANNTIDHPIFDDKGKRIGYYKSISITPLNGDTKAPNGALQISISMEVEDHDACVVIDLIPYLSDDGVLTLHPYPVKSEIDLNFWENFGVFIGSVLLPPAGYIITNIVVGKMLSDGESELSKSVLSKISSLADLSSVIPVRTNLFKKAVEPITHPVLIDCYDLVNTFDEFTIDSLGISVAGHTHFEVRKEHSEVEVSIEPSENIPREVLTTVTIFAKDSYSKENLDGRIKIMEKSLPGDPVPNDIRSNVPFDYIFRPTTKKRPLNNRISMRPIDNGGNGGGGVDDGGDNTIELMPKAKINVPGYLGTTIDIPLA